MSARIPYTLKDGAVVPSCTTIIGRFKEAGPLMHWAWEQGKAGKDFREERDKAADAGTLAHKAVEAWVRGDKAFTMSGEIGVVAKAQTAYGAFLEWAQQTRLEVVESEVRLVSEAHRFGGTLDAMLIQGKLALGDWKSSNGLYADYLLQLAGYALLWEESFPDRPIEGGFHLLRFDKTHGDFTHRWFAELEAAKRAFLLMRDLYDIDKELKKRIK